MPEHLVPTSHSDPALAAALAEAGLPTADLAASPAQFFRAVDDRFETVGYAGIELHGDEALLRSVVILPARRGRGFGADLVAAMLAAARNHGARRVWLLTMDAAPFFARQGFSPADRGQAPRAIAATGEFARLCPASAACMVHLL